MIISKDIYCICMHYVSAYAKDLKLSRDFDLIKI